MRYPYPFAVVRSAVVSILTNQFARRLTISVLLTGFDGSVFFAVLPTMSEASKYIPGLAMVFAVLVVGLAATLTRTWFLTFRDRNLEAVPAAHTHWHEEGRVP
jgi:hypothetical protein